MFVGIAAALVTDPVAVKRHHDQGNSYKGQHSIGAGLQAQRFSPLLSAVQSTEVCATVECEFIS